MMREVAEVDFRQSILVRFVAAALLVAAPTFDWPYGYYTFLRWVVALTAAWLIVQVWEHRTPWKFVFAAIAILFNPLVPVYLDAATWAVLDIATATLLAVSTYPISNRLHRTTTARGHRSESHGLNDR